MEARVKAIREYTQDELVWLLEHPAIYTAGSSAKNRDLLNNNGFPVYHTGRGGQYTYHGPGQRIIYVLLDLKKRNPDIRRYVKNLEDCVINTLAAFGVKGEIREGRVGVWVKQGNTEQKIAAIGVRVKHWVTYHGVSVNIFPDLSHYDGIIPCGIKEFGITSFESLGIECSLSSFDETFKKSFEAIAW